MTLGLIGLGLNACHDISARIKDRPEALNARGNFKLATHDIVWRLFSSSSRTFKSFTLQPVRPTRFWPKVAPKRLEVSPAVSVPGRPSGATGRWRSNSEPAAWHPLGGKADPANAMAAFEHRLVTKTGERASAYPCGLHCRVKRKSLTLLN